MLHSDICIAGAGVIGLSLALELHARNLRVTVIESGHPFREASWAAAGMLAAQDPHNPLELSALAQLSVALYEQFLERIETLGGLAVPFQTSRTLQSIGPSGSRHAPLAGTLFDSSANTFPVPPAYRLIHEHSIDPRQLSASLFAALAATSIRLLAQTLVVSTKSTSSGVEITTSSGTIEAAHFIDCTGAWAGNPDYLVIPIKGQMLAVELPADFQIDTTLRTADIYVVPRTIGPRAGQAIIGATVEDIGFDKTLHASQIDELRQQAIHLLPELAGANVLDAWSGLRPATSDRLPIIGPHPTRPHHWISTGHYRNGILLAPGTARVLGQLIVGGTISVPLGAFSPLRESLRNTAAQ